MKTGKNLKINGYKDIKVSYGTVNFKEFKSVYLNIQSWVTPKMDLENWNHVVNNLNREIKHCIFSSLNQNFFRENFIVDLDLRSGGISYGKKSFTNLEITFYVKPHLDFKSPELKNEFRRLSSYVNEKILQCNKYFNFSSSKKNSELNDLVYIYR